MTPTEEAEWQQRLQAAVAETVRRREARRQQREQLNAARTHGLQQRHRQRLNHACRRNH
jgi:imidazolonepropionase-like amidohydrolase